jgi:hypothetical protein
MWVVIVIVLAVALLPAVLLLAIFLAVPVVLLAVLMPRAASLLASAFFIPFRSGGGRDRRRQALSFRVETIDGLREVLLESVDHGLALGDDVDVLGEVRRGQVLALRVSNRTTGMTLYSPVARLVVDGSLLVAAILLLTVVGRS